MCHHSGVKKAPVFVFFGVFFWWLKGLPSDIFISRYYHVGTGFSDMSSDCIGQNGPSAEHTKGCFCVSSLVQYVSVRQEWSDGLMES